MSDLSARLERLMNRRASALRGRPKPPAPAQPFDAPQSLARPPLPNATAADATLKARLAQLRGPPTKPEHAHPNHAPKTPEPVAPMRSWPVEARPSTQVPPSAEPVTHRTKTPEHPAPSDRPRDTSIGGRLDSLLTTLGAGPAQPSAPPDQQRLMQALRGHVRATPHGEYYVICDAIDLTERHGDLALDQALQIDPAHTAVLAKGAQFASFDPRTALFFDLETTGLATTMGTLPFLIGAAHVHHGQVILEQWLLRDPDEEAAALTALAERIAEADWLVSFNGRSFDWPLLEARFALHRIAVSTDHLLGHLDLLHAARRLLRHALPNCKLTTLETHVLGLHRVDDTPGSQVPATYHAYLSGGDPHPLIGVVKHNRDDILSMLTLLGALLDRVAHAPSWALRDPPSSIAVAKAAVSLGRLDDAEAIYQALCDFPATQPAGETGMAQVKRRRQKVAGWAGTRKR